MTTFDLLIRLIPNASPDHIALSYAPVANEQCRIDRRMPRSRNIHTCIEDLHWVLQETFHTSLFDERRPILSFQCGVIIRVL